MVHVDSQPLPAAEGSHAGTGVGKALLSSLSSREDKSGVLALPEEWQELGTGIGGAGGVLAIASPALTDGWFD